VALYMFVWPTFRRLVVAPWLGTAQVIEDGRTVHTLPPHWAWLGQSAPFPKDGFEAHFVVEDFWATFPEWYIAVPYLFACGFAVVYFLGAKGFCTYGCPYGGFFGPVDRLSPLRIRVTDACEHCGHCTAVCTSNVRVSDEVRDFGAVVDPGCMKCMDCVSVCPTGALYVGAGAPALFTKARTPAAGWKHKAQKAARYDLTLGEEALCGVVLLATTIGVRGSVLFGFTVPLLMALGLGAINAFVAHKLWRVVRDAHVRGPHVQLKRSGRLTRAGVVFALVGSAALLTAGLGMVTKVCQGMGEYHAAALRERVFPSAERAKWGEINAKFFADTYIPDSEVAARARVALSWFGRADSIWRGGWGLWREPEATAKMGWPALVAGDAALAETVLRRAAGQRWRLDDPVVLDVADVMVLRARREGTLATLNARLEEWYRGALARDHRLLRVRGQLAELLSVSAQRAGKPTDDAAKLLVDAAKAHPGDDDLVDHASMTLLRMGRLSEAREVLELGLSKRPLSAALNVNLAFALAVPNEESRDPATIMRAEKLLSLAQNHVGEDDAATLGKMAQLHQFFGRQAEAAEYQKRAEAAAKRARRE
jgi:ferredoxin